MAKNCWALSCVLKSLRVAQAAEVAVVHEAAVAASMTEVDLGVSDEMEPAAASDRLENDQEVSAAVEVGVAAVASDHPVIEATTRAQVEEASIEAPVAISPQEAALATGQAALEEDARMTDPGHHKAADSKHKSFFSVFI
jgi:hypothetical protein